MTDLLLAGLLAATALAGSAFVLHVDLAGCLLVLGAASALAVRRRWPLVTLAVAAGCTSLYLALGYSYGPILVLFMIAVYGVPRLWPAAAALALMLVHLVTSEREFGWLGAGPVVAWVVVPATAGYAVRLRREAARRAHAEAVRQRVDEERLRVAREVHDVVGHGLAAIKMQADVALHVLPRNPGHAEAALRAISDSSGQALAELRSVLAAVHDREPATGLAGLARLRDRMADAGLHVTLDTEGERAGPLPEAVDLTGYRVVQESLTNVLRHGGGKHADVTLRHEPGRLEITVSNPITGTPQPDGAGTGIAGMRSRVEALGGELRAGPVGRRFEVHARLPA